MNNKEFEIHLRENLDKIYFNNFALFEYVSKDFFREFRDKFNKDDLTLKVFIAMYKVGGEELIEELFGNESFKYYKKY